MASQDVPTLHSKLRLRSSQTVTRNWQWLAPLRTSTDLGVRSWDRRMSGDRYTNISHAPRKTETSFLEMRDNTEMIISTNCLGWRWIFVRKWLFKVSCPWSGGWHIWPSLSDLPYPGRCSRVGLIYRLLQVLSHRASVCWESLTWHYVGPCKWGSHICCWPGPRSVRDPHEINQHQLHTYT